jgi:hypothetical protein
MQRIAAVVVVTLVALIVLWVLYPDLNDRDYGKFADDVAGHGLRNVLSNAGFLLVGIAGFFCIRRRDLGGDDAAALTFFAGVTLTAFGSAWFHLQPRIGGMLNRGGLLLDRLPMTIAFAALLALVFRDRVLRRHHRWLLPLMIVLGTASLVYWYACDRLLPYAFFQGYTAAGTLLLIALLRPTYTGARYMLAAVVFFGIAKVCEARDQQFFDALQFGGHPLKHVAGALAALMILLWLRFRRHLVGGGNGALGP